MVIVSSPPGAGAVVPPGAGGVVPPGAGDVVPPGADDLVRERVQYLLTESGLLTEELFRALGYKGSK